MCFTIPMKVLEVNGKYVTLEGNMHVAHNRDVKIKKGDYVRILGNIVVDRLSAKAGMNVRRLIKNLNTTI